jgi:hypothetical protein
MFLNLSVIILILCFSTMARAAEPLPISQMMGLQPLATADQKVLTRGEFVSGIIAKQMGIDVKSNQVQFGIMGVSLLNYSRSHQISVSYSRSF